MKNAEDRGQVPKSKRPSCLSNSQHYSWDIFSRNYALFRILKCSQTIGDTRSPASRTSPIDGKGREETVRPGEFTIVPHGVEHMPYTLEETHIILFEPGTTLNTGNLHNERTVADLQRL